MFFFQDWMAFEELHQPLFREHGSIYFSNGKKPSKQFNYAFCEVCLQIRVLFTLELHGINPFTAAFSQENAFFLTV